MSALAALGAYASSSDEDDAGDAVPGAGSSSSTTGAASLPPAASATTTGASDTSKLTETVPRLASVRTEHRLLPPQLRRKRANVNTEKELEFAVKRRRSSAIGDGTGPTTANGVDSASTTNANVPGEVAAQVGGSDTGKQELRQQQHEDQGIQEATKKSQPHPPSQQHPPQQPPTQPHPQPPQQPPSQQQQQHANARWHPSQMYNLAQHQYQDPSLTSAGPPVASQAAHQAFPIVGQATGAAGVPIEMQRDMRRDGGVGPAVVSVSADAHRVTSFEIGTGASIAASKVGGVSRRKNQISFLAYDASARSEEIAERAKRRKQSQGAIRKRYGW